jgi:hypothetical protein
VLIDETNMPSEIFGGEYQARSDGADIRFSTDTGGATELARDIVNFSLTSNVAQVWVRVPSISSSTNTTIYMWYDNSSATEPAKNSTYGAGNTWSSYKCVYHLEEVTNNTASGYKDATNNNYHGTGTSMALTREVLKSGLDYGQHFDGSNDYISLPSGTNSPSNTVTATFESWIKADARGGLDGWLGCAPSCGMLFSNYTTSDRMMTGWWNGGSDEYNANTGLNTGQTNPAFTAYRVYSTGRRVHMNTSYFTWTNTTTAQSTNTQRIGIERTITSRCFNGKEDEARIVWADKGHWWVIATYHTSNDADTFAIEGTPVYTGPPLGPDYNDMRQSPRGVNRGVDRGVT